MKRLSPQVERKRKKVQKVANDPVRDYLELQEQASLKNTRENPRRRDSLGASFGKPRRLA